MPDQTRVTKQAVETWANRLSDGGRVRVTKQATEAWARRLPPNVGRVRVTKQAIEIWCKRAQPGDDFQYGLPLVGVMR